ncbi:MAG: hypothetical protein ACREOV_05370, partial [Candidatus Dormibacteraceae bacterium]
SGKDVHASLHIGRPDDQGTVRVKVDTKSLKPGRYTVTLEGDVLTQATSFTVKKGQSKPWWDPF